MKRRFCGAALAVTMLLTLTACGRTDNNDSQADNTGTSGVNYSEQLKKDMENYKNYVTLGTYKGVEVTVDKSALDVKPEQITAYIDNIRSSRGESKEVTSGTTKTGDIIKLDYSGKLNGVAFSGGTATDVQYTVGSGKFIKDLDNGLAGLEVGQEYNIPCHFDDNYGQEELNGKDVIFTVKVSAIVEKVLPEYNDEFVKTIVGTGAYDTDAQTTADFTAYVEKTLKEDAQKSYESDKYEQIWDKLNETTQVSGYPEEELNSVTQTVINNVKSEYSYYGTYYGINSFEDYVKQVYQFSNEEEFNNYAKEYSQSYLKEKMILTLIGEQEGITVSDDEIKEYGATIASENGYESYQKIIEEFGDDIQLEVGYSVLADKVSDILLASADEK